jgi:predicted dienelactone hydrolase
MAVDPEDVVIEEPVEESDVPVQLRYVETMDGLYAPIGLRLPSGDGPFPVVLLASGNGGGGMAWIRDAVRNRGYVMEKLLEAGYACAWLRYRTEVELGYNDGGRLVRDGRQGRELFNRSPLEYEDEIAVIEYMKRLPEIDPERIGLVGMSHGGEMVFKLTSEYHGAAVGVASEPANHEFLWLTPDETATVNPETGRETDELQGIFRLSYELLAEAGKDAEWVSFDHDLHGYIYPMRGADGEYEVDETQEEAIASVIAYLDRHIGPAR